MFLEENVNPEQFFPVYYEILFWIAISNSDHDTGPLHRECHVFTNVPAICDVSLCHADSLYVFFTARVYFFFSTAQTL